MRSTRLRSTLFLAATFTVGSISSCAQSASRSYPGSKPVTAAVDQDGPREVDPVGQRQVNRAYEALPLAFEANVGQADSLVKFVSRGRGHMLLIAPAEAVLVVRSGSGLASLRSAGSDRYQETRETVTDDPTVLRMQLVGADATARMSGENQLPGWSNYFVGGDPAAWRTRIPNYASVRCEDVWPGVHLVYRGSTLRRLEYDFVVSPGADPGVIKIRFEGAESLKLDPRGNLLIDTAAGPIIHGKPLVYQQVGDRWQEIEGSYRLAPDGGVGFALAAYDTEVPLVIDPVVEYSSYLGGNTGDLALAIAVDDHGSTYLAGYTLSSNFPVSSAFQGTRNGGYDVFVTRFSPAGDTLLYSTFLGGRKDDLAAGIAIDSDGNAYVAGETVSDDFPVSAALQGSKNENVDAFVAKLTPTGDVLRYSTFLGGSGIDRANAIAVDAAGSAYVTGATGSSDFPLANPLQVTHHGGEWEGFVTKLAPAGNVLTYSTLLGGNDIDWPSGIAVDSQGNAYVTGYTRSADFPVFRAFQETKGGQNVFVTKLAATGNALAYSTFLGGSSRDQGQGIDVDSDGAAYVTGHTTSSDFPVFNGFQEEKSSVHQDVFVTKLAPGGDALVYSTYLGGRGMDVGYDIAVDLDGSAFVTGFTDSNDFPLSAAFQQVRAGDRDAFITKLVSAGNALAYSSYLGGTNRDEGTAIGVDGRGTAYLTGYTTSTNFPVKGALQGSNGGGYDVFLARISFCGDSVIDLHEDCDDGDLNGTSGSCCSPACDFQPDGSDCEDGSPLSTADTCKSGICEPGFVPKLPITPFPLPVP